MANFKQIIEAFQWHLRILLDGVNLDKRFLDNFLLVRHDLLQGFFIFSSDVVGYVRKEGIYDYLLLDEHVDIQLLSSLFVGGSFSIGFIEEWLHSWTALRLLRLLLLKS